MAGQIYLASNKFESSKNNGRSNIMELSKIKIKILAGQGGEVVRVRQMRAAYLKYPFSGYLSPSTCYILIFVLFRISQPHLDILYFSGCPSLNLMFCTFPDISAPTCATLIFCTWMILLFLKDKIPRKLLQESWLLCLCVEPR